MDLTPPTVAITSPTAGATVAGVTQVTVSASDNVGVTQVGVYLDGVLAGASSDDNASFTWDTTAVADGSHTLVAAAQDAAGNTCTSSATTVSVRNTADTAAPTIAITSPINGAKVKSKGTISVRVSVTDDVGVVRVDLYVDGNFTSTSTAAPFTTSWNTSKATRGAHTLVCKACDAAGNVGTSQTVTVYK
jgi:hypothetical protein